MSIFIASLPQARASVVVTSSDTPQMSHNAFINNNHTPDNVEIESKQQHNLQLSRSEKKKLQIYECKKAHLARSLSFHFLTCARPGLIVLLEEDFA